MSSAPRPAERGRRCAACGARNGPAAVWCTLCLAALDEPRRTAPPRPAPAEPATGPVPQQRSADPPQGEADRAFAEQQAERLLAELSVAETTPHGERIAAFARAGPTAGMMFSLVGGVAAFLLLIAVMAVVGRVL